MRSRRTAGDDVDTFFDSSVHIPTRTLFLGTECDAEMAELFIKGMALLAPIEGEITILMNNIGGDEYHGLAVYDAIATCRHPVTIKVFGHAMSMGSWILQAADHRLMAPHSTLMLHTGTWGDHVHEGNTARNIKSLAAEGARIDRLMEEAYLNSIRSKHPKFPLATLRKYLADETYLSAEQAVTIGLADEVL